MNKLMIAAEHGDSNAVDLCIKSGINVNEKVNGILAVDLAWNNQHFEIVLDLLKANSQFPSNFNDQRATDGIKSFKNVTEKLHILILKEDIEEISSILKEHPNLRHFYSIGNISAPAFALINRKFKVYEFLIANNVYIGTDENIDEIFKELSNSKCKDLKKIHLKYLKNFRESHLIILAMNSKIIGGIENAVDKMVHVRRTFKFLDKVDPFLSLILQIVAASRDFKIIFDFESSGTLETDPKEDKKRNPIYEIKIQANGLLDPAKVQSVYESVIFELCIYAMELVYKNYGRPYSCTDDKSRKLFNKIATACEVNHGNEELNDFSYVNKPNLYHAKLIALVPQMMVKYSNDLAKMDECRNKFSSLFEFCQNVIEPEMKHKLPTIKSSAEQKAQKFQTLNKKQTKMLIALVLAIPFAIWLTFLLAKPYIEPIYICGNLTDDLRSKIFESTVEFQGVNVIFGDLFGRNASACEDLSPQEVTNMIRVFDSGKFVINYTGVYVNFTAEENELIAKSSNFEHLEGIKKQNCEEGIKEKQLIDTEEYINIKYRYRRFREPSLKINHAVELRSKFYIDRWTIKNFTYNGFVNLTNTKFLLLSDKGGSGKSTYFRHMAWKLKRRFPLKWISYIDLKQYIHALQDVPKNGSNLTTIADFLSSKLLNLTSKIEIEIFKRKFLKNESIFLWDGVDEVSPVYLNGTVSLIGMVRNSTNNTQWMSTRPHLKTILNDTFNIITTTFVEFFEEDKVKFIKKYLETNEIEGRNLSKVLSEIDEYLTRINTIMYTDQQPVQEFKETNPQMLYIVCSIYNKNMSVSIKSNLYTIYEDYVNKCFEDVVFAKGQVVQDDTMVVAERGHFRKYHQEIAASHQADNVLLLLDMDDEKKFIIKKWKNFDKFQSFESRRIMRFGILFRKGNETIFEHQTFRDFYLAQYYLDNVWSLTDGAPRDDEITYRLELLFYTLRNCHSIYRVTCDFILGFIEAYSDQRSQPFDKLIKSAILSNYSSLKETVSTDLYRIEIATRFFMKDKDVINAMWKVDQNRSFFHEFLESSVSPSEMEEMTTLIGKLFNPEVVKNIIEGKHQAGNFLRMAWQRRNLKRHLLAFLRTINFKCESTCKIEELLKIKTFKGFMEYFEKQNYSREEILDFFKISANKRTVKDVPNLQIFREYAEKLLSAEDLNTVKDYWSHHTS